MCGVVYGVMCGVCMVLCVVMYEDERQASR